MHKKVLNVTPSFLLKLMQKCANYDSEMEVIQAFEKISSTELDILTSEDLDTIEQDAEDNQQDDVPDHLSELRDALEGAVTDAAFDDESDLA